MNIEELNKIIAEGETHSMQSKAHSSYRLASINYSTATEVLQDDDNPWFWLREAIMEQSRARILYIAARAMKEAL